jgi:SH3-like domain-containing protein
MLSVARKILFGVVALLGLCNISLAKDINLYDQPDEKAKVIGTVDLSAGIIPILTPKEGSWIKVADPRNGNVGWIKSNEMNADGGNPSAVTFTQRVINNGSGPQYDQMR